ncbi:MAG: SPFH domain-containing protein [Prevotellaceae bacterium]|jgi:regulator of protease activity HflC (stomatin/prohibitin superfamily)|nr:SPFH domain-containing protein [Prevotellaceae bacterium]
MKTQEEKFSKVKLSGVGMLIFNFLFLAAIIAALVMIIDVEDFTPLSLILVIADIILFVIHIIFWAGFVQIEPNEAQIMVFFGKYEGTIKENGFFWVNPFYAKKKLTLRARNLDAEPIKVNDKKGNPVMIGQVLVWRVADTYKASFDIDNTSKTTANLGVMSNVNQKMKAFEYFVKVQSDAALRYVAGMFAYDNSENEDEKLTLRSGVEDINEILEQQLNERLSIAGIEVLEARVNYLAYAPEIAAVMLRRQQADAIISAREKIVDGAVGMVKHALSKLSEEKIVELDDEKKAAMVSNLLVVLCSDERAQPIVNTGTLYN